MGVDRGISCGAGEAIPFLLRYVLASARVLVAFRKSKVDDIDRVPVSPFPDEEVLWFYVAVDDSSLYCKAFYAVDLHPYCKVTLT